MEPPTGPETQLVRAGEQRSYYAYLLRLWMEQRDGQPAWRASLEDPHTGQRLGFAELTQLFEFLQRQTGSRQPVWSPDIESKGTKGSETL